MTLVFPWLYVDPATVKQRPHGWLGGGTGNLLGLMTYNNRKHLNPADLFPVYVTLTLTLYVNE